ncbi:carbohydrate ABC transporter permease [Streptomyces sp. NPDC088747]|uniref:carbohydrate ABC transporter permease n=1 Tax=Streptomyces sp. NPDC088747 TaxID=3365886 RepID=UPI003826CC07
MRKESLQGLLFVLPACIGFAVFYLWPTVRGIYYSFTEYSVLSPPTWVGLENYTHMVHDDVFWKSLVVTVEFVVLTVVLQTVVSMGIAMLMHRLTNSLLIRGVILFPFLISGVVVALAWFWIADYQIGIANELLRHLGANGTPFFGDTGTALLTVAFVSVWRGMGYTALLLFAGLLTIPPQVYEASALDGASGLRTFRSITLPLLRPVVAMVLVLTVIGSFQVFDIIAVTTKGGPVDATRVISYYIYQLAFTQSQFGYASAISVVLFVVLAIVSFVQLRLMRANQSDLA